MRRLIESDRSLAILLVAFGALALFYSLIIPLFEGPDEDDHFRYARFIADERALPVQQFIGGGGDAGHQGWQPPLYYTLAALVISPLDTSDLQQHLWRNPAGTFLGDPACCGRNIYFHTDSENFPFTGTTLAVHLARLLSILFGALTVWATYRICQVLSARKEPQDPTGLPRAVPLAVAAVVAFNPSFLFASALVSNDAMLAALAAIILLWWVRLLNGQLALAPRYAAVLGVLLGLAVLTKTTALGLIPFTIVVVSYVAWRRKDVRAGGAAIALMLGIAVLLSGWWFVRNQLLYGDPLAYHLMTVSAIFPRAGPLTMPELLQISLPWLWQTFWGGPTPGDFAPVVLVLLAVLSLIAVGGMVIFFIRNRQPAVRASVLVLAAWLGFIFIAQIQFIRTTVGADQGRYLFPAISALAFFLVVGLVQLSTTLKHYASWVTSFALVGGSLMLALLVPFAYTLPAYARPALLASSEVSGISHLAHATFGGQFQLLGYDLNTHSVKPGDTVKVNLYWRALTAMPESYRVFVHLIGQDNRSAGGIDVIPGRGAFPTVYWKPGDTLRDTVAVPVQSNAMPGKYSVEIGVYPSGDAGGRLTVTESGDDRVVVDTVKVAPLHGVAYMPQTRLGATFDSTADLTGYDARVDGDQLLLTLYWQSIARFERDYTVFVHVLDAGGKIVAQADRQPQDGNYPTSMWDPGEQVKDGYEFALPRPGEYRVEIGIYRQDTGERLPVSGGGSDGDHVAFSLP